MLICSCYGLCKCPCKRSMAREPHTPSRNRDSSNSSSRRRRRERPMIPLPSPGTGAMINQSTSSTFQHHSQKLPTTSLADQPIYSKLQFGRNHPPAAHAVAAPRTMGSFREDERRRNQLSPSRFSVPPSTSAPANIMHLSQLQSHSYHSDLEQMALGTGSINPPSIGRQGGRAYNPSHPQQQRHELSSIDHHHHHHQPSRQVPGAPWNNTTTNGNSAGHIPPPTYHHNHHQQNNAALPPHFQAKPVDIPPPYPGMGYPYTPCKSPHSTSATSSTAATISQPSALSHSQLHNRRMVTRQQEEEEEQACASGAEGQGAAGLGSRGMEGESEILTDIDSVVETNSVVSGGRGRIKELATSPPSYSTEV